MVVLDNLVVTTALPSIRADLGGGLQALEWTVNAYTLTFAVLLMTGAALGDRFGRRRMFVIGLGIFTVASAAAALAPTHRRADRRPRAPGRRRRDRHAAHADAALDRVPGREARPRDRRLVGHLRPRRRARPARRRRRRRRHLVALDLLAQRPDRHRARAARLRRLTSPAAGGPARPRPGSRSAGSACSASSTASCAAPSRLDRARTCSARSSPARSCSRLRRLGAARAGADAADALLPRRAFAPPTASRSRCTSASSARSSCSPSSSRSSRATRRWRPACGRCRGPACRCSSRRSRACSPTASARAR